MSDNKELYIRSSSAEFIIFSSQAEENSVEIRYEDGTLWLSQKMIGVLFDVSKATVSEHMKNIFESGELEEHGTVRKFRTVQNEGNRKVNREITHYNLDVIISVGYRVNSIRATQFRRWATGILKKYTLQSYPTVFHSSYSTIIKF